MRCTIPDAAGVDREYDVTKYEDKPVPGPGPHYLLSRLDTAARYVVALTAEGPVCSCKDFSCNGKGNNGLLCKHAGWCLKQSQDGVPSMLASAQRYLAAGLNVIPVRPGTKEPALPAGHPVLNHERRLTETELLRWWIGSNNGIAIKGGALSGHLEILDLDRKDLWDEWAAIVEEEAPGLLNRLPQIETGKGWHVYWRCSEGIAGNLKLAREAGPDGRPITLAETRGEGGYVLAPPTHHPDGGTYKIIHGDLASIPEITADERSTLLDAARALNRWVPSTPPVLVRASTGPAGDDSPGNDFNKRADFAGLLTDAGWVCERVRGPLSYWRRPGKDKGVSATLGLTSEGSGRTLFYVFSSNAYPLEPDHSYDAFGFYCRWFHNGDLQAGARALLDQGYGTPSVPLKMRFTPLKSGQEAPAEWETPIPIGSAMNLPDFPTEVLPPWMAAWVEALATATQTPPDLAASLCIGAAAGALARRYRVEVRPGWTEPLNLFVVVALPPANRKSAVFEETMRPVVSLERSEQARMKPIVAQKESEHRILEERLKAAEREAAKAEEDAERHMAKERAAQLARELADHEVPVLPRFWCDDTTPAMLSKLIAEQGGRMLQAGAEGTAFEHAKGKHSETPDFDVYLKGHSGDPFRVDRVQRDGEDDDRPALSCALTVQPDVIHGLAEETSLRGRGFLGRWLYSIPISTVGRRATRPAPVPDGVRTDFTVAMTRLWATPNKSDGNEVILRLGAVGDGHIEALQRWLEPRLTEGESLSFMADWAGKLAGGVARIAAVLHVAAAVGQGAIPEQLVSDSAVAAAVRIGRDYLVAHAAAAFGLMGGDKCHEDARRVVTWILKSVHSVISKRDVHKNVFAGRCKVADLDPVLKLLVEHGYLTPAHEETRTGPGRKPSTKYDVNPKIYDLSPPETMQTFWTEPD